MNHFRHWTSGLLLAAAFSVQAQNTVPCFGGDEYSAMDMPAVDPNTGLPCRAPTEAEESARLQAVDSGGYSQQTYPQQNDQQGYAQPAPASGWNGQGSSGGQPGGSGSNQAYGGSSGYGNSGGIQGGSFVGKGSATQGGGNSGYGSSSANPYASGREFKKPVKNDPQNNPSPYGAYGMPVDSATQGYDTYDGASGPSSSYEDTSPP